MAQKIKPTTFRLGITVPWQSRWFFKKPLNYFIEEDWVIREAIKEKAAQSGIASISIERTRDTLRVSIKTARPGLIIGRGGKGAEELKNFTCGKITALRKKRSKTGKFSFNLNIEEVRRSEVSANVVAGQITGDIERRMPCRTVMKRQLELLRQRREVLGAKIRVAGRLNGAEISRREWLGWGRMPSQTLRSDIDYGEATAFTTYGAIGVKVWIYKGEVFDKSDEKSF